MSGAYWYWGLVGLSLILLAVALWRRKDWKLLVLHLSLPGIIQPFEILIMHFNGYRYVPGMLPGSSDTYAGAIVSDMFILPASAAVISAFSLGWPARILFAVLFAGIDWYFAALGIYQHTWWKSVYTFIVLIPLYAASGWLWAGLQAKTPPRLFRLLIIYLCYAYFHNLINFLAERGTTLYKMQIAALVPAWQGADEIKVHVALAGSQAFIAGAVTALAIGLKMPFRWRIAAGGAIILINWALGYSGIFVPQTAGITSQHLNLLTLSTLPLLAGIFKAARLDYLFP